MSKQRQLTFAQRLALQVFAAARNGAESFPYGVQAVQQPARKH